MSHRGISRGFYSACAIVVSVTIAGGCGVDEQVDEIASCLEPDVAEVSSGSEGPTGSIGQINTRDPTATIHVFETETGAKDYVEQSNSPGGVAVDSGFEAAGNLAFNATDQQAAKLIRGCA